MTSSNDGQALSGESVKADYRPSCAGDSEMRVLAYECRPAINALVASLRPFLGTGEFIVFRDAFRWKRDNGHLDGFHNRGDLINNGYEMFGVESIAEMCGADVIWDFNHVAVCRAKATGAHP